MKKPDEDKADSGAEEIASEIHPGNIHRESPFPSFNESMFRHVTGNQYIEALLKNRDHVLAECDFEYIEWLYDLFNRKPLSEKITDQEIHDNSKKLRERLMKEGFERKIAKNATINVRELRINGTRKTPTGLVRTWDVPADLDLKNGDTMEITGRDGQKYGYKALESTMPDGTVLLLCTDGPESVINKKRILLRQKKGLYEGWNFRICEEKPGQKDVLMSKDGQDIYKKHEGNIDDSGGKFDWLSINGGYDKTLPVRRYYLDVKMSKMHDIFHDLYKILKKNNIRVSMKVLDHLPQDIAEEVERIDEIIVYCNPSQDSGIKIALAEVHSNHEKDFNTDESHYMASHKALPGINIGEEAVSSQNQSRDFLEEYKRKYGFKIGNGKKFDLDTLLRDKKGGAKSYSQIRSWLLEKSLQAAAYVFMDRKSTSLDDLQMEQVLAKDFDNNEAKGILKKNYSMIVTSDLFKIIMRRFCIALNLDPDAMESNLEYGYGTRLEQNAQEVRDFERKYFRKGDIIKIRSMKDNYFEFLVLSNNGVMKLKCIAGLNDYADKEYEYSGIAFCRNEKITLNGTGGDEALKIQIHSLDRVKL